MKATEREEVGVRVKHRAWHVRFGPMFRDVRCAPCENAVV